VSYAHAPFEWMYSTRSSSRVRFLIWPSVTRSNFWSSSVHRVITSNLAPKEPTCKQRGQGWGWGWVRVTVMVLETEKVTVTAPAQKHRQPPYLPASELSRCVGSNSWPPLTEVCSDMYSNVTGRPGVATTGLIDQQGMGQSLSC